VSSTVVAIYLPTYPFIYFSLSFFWLSCAFPPPAALTPPLEYLYIALDLSIHSTRLLFSRGQISDLEPLYSKRGEIGRLEEKK